jgi:hypothetical protein
LTDVKAKRRLPPTILSEDEDSDSNHLLVGDGQGHSDEDPDFSDQASASASDNDEDEDGDDLDDLGKLPKTQLKKALASEVSRFFSTISYSYTDLSLPLGCRLPQCPQEEGV